MITVARIGETERRLEIILQNDDFNVGMNFLDKKYPISYASVGTARFDLGVLVQFHPF